MSDMSKAIYDAVLITAGTTLVGMISKNVLKEPLGTPGDGKSFLKLGVAIGLGTFIVSYAEKKKWVPEDPFDNMTNSMGNIIESSLLAERLSKLIAIFSLSIITMVYIFNIKLTPITRFDNAFKIGAAFLISRQIAIS